jgi:DNA/RNA-binding domain of Phe-tRNA-synthetase-like protein
VRLVLTIEDILDRFDSYRVGVVLVEDLVLLPERTAALEAAVRAAADEARATLGETALAEVPELRAWREAYKAFGVKRTSYRSSVERLLKRVVQGEELPRVNTLVDMYNAVSVRYRMPVGADDLAKVVSPLAFRYARVGDTFVRLGDETQTPDPPVPGEVVYTDAEKCLCRRWNWAQDARSAIGAQTTRAVLTVQALAAEPAGQVRQVRRAGDIGRVEEATLALCGLLAEHCGARTAWAVADRERPSVSIALD